MSDNTNLYDEAWFKHRSCECGARPCWGNQHKAHSDCPRWVAARAVELVAERAPSTPAPPIADDAALVEAMAKAICKADGFDPTEDSFPMHADPAKNQPYPAWHDYMSHARFAISAARPAIERSARAKALDDAGQEIERYARWRGLPVAPSDLKSTILALKDRT